MFIKKKRRNRKNCSFRTVGDMSCTAAVDSACSNNIRSREAKLDCQQFLRGARIDKRWLLMEKKTKDTLNSHASPAIGENHNRL
jgi:hypothetical protein